MRVVRPWNLCNSFVRIGEYIRIEETAPQSVAAGDALGPCLPHLALTSRADNYISYSRALALASS